MRPIPQLLLFRSCFFSVKVAKLAAQIEQEQHRARAKASAMTEEKTVAVEREAKLRTNVEALETDLQGAREREREAVNSAANLKAELLVGQDAIERTEAALATALEQIRAAEETAQSHARAAEAAERNIAKATEAARQDKETLKRGLVAAQAQAAAHRAELSRVQQTQLDRTAAAGQSPGGVGLRDATTAVAAAAEAAVAEAAEAAAASAVQMRSEFEERIVLAQAEATEARTEVQRLKSKLQNTTPASVGGEGGNVSPLSPFRATSGIKRSAGTRGELAKTTHHRNREGRPVAPRIEYIDVLQDAHGMMDRVALALSEAVNETSGGSRSRGDNDLNDPRWAAPQTSPRGTMAKQGNRAGRVRHRRALSADSFGRDELAVFEVKEGERYTWGGSEEAEEEGGVQEEALSRAEVLATSERLRFSAAKLLAVRREEKGSADVRLARLRQELRDSEAREADTAARLEESREVSRTLNEQYFVACISMLSALPTTGVLIMCNGTKEDVP